MSRLSFILVVLLSVALSEYVSCHRILAITPTLSISHFKSMEPLLLELVKRGHQLTVVSNFPQKAPVANYTDIDGKFCNGDFQKTIQFINDIVNRRLHFVHSLKQFYESIKFSECFLKLTPFRELLRANQTFDLVIAEYFTFKLFTVLGDFYKVPVIHVSSCMLPPWVSKDYGNPLNPAYIQHNLGGATDRMTFVERLKNTIKVFIMLLTDKLAYTKKMQEYSDRYFENVSSMEEVMLNYSSLVLVNSHCTVNGFDQWFQMWWRWEEYT